MPPGAVRRGVRGLGVLRVAFGHLARGIFCAGRRIGVGPGVGVFGLGTVPIPRRRGAPARLVVG
jgi:hypothetical protein